MPFIWPSSLLIRQYALFLLSWIKTDVYTYSGEIVPLNLVYLSISWYTIQERCEHLLVFALFLFFALLFSFRRPRNLSLIIHFMCSDIEPRSFSVFEFKLIWVVNSWTESSISFIIYCKLSWKFGFGSHFFTLVSIFSLSYLQYNPVIHYPIASFSLILLALFHHKCSEKILVVIYFILGGKREINS